MQLFTHRIAYIILTFVERCQNSAMLKSLVYCRFYTSVNSKELKFYPSFFISQKRLGALNLEKCVELGVKPGPLLGKLKNGQDVVLPDGTLVLSKQVKTPDDPGPVFIGMYFIAFRKKAKYWNTSAAKMCHRLFKKHC